MENGMKEESFEEKCAREKAERKIRVLKIEKKLEKILMLLGCEILKRKNEKDNLYYDAKAIGKLKGGEIYLNVGRYGIAEGMISVSCGYPYGSDNRYVEVYEMVKALRSDGSEYDRMERVVSPRINVSFEKDSVQIAKDIQRRLIPGYEKRLQLVLEQISKDERYKSELLSSLKVMKLACVGEAPDEREIAQNEFGYYLQRAGDDCEFSKRVEVKVGGSYVDLKIDSLSQKEALALVFALKDIVKGGK